MNDLEQQNSQLNNKIDDLNTKITDLNATIDDLNMKLDIMTWELLGLGIVNLILVKQYYIRFRWRSNLTEVGYHPCEMASAVEEIDDADVLVRGVRAVIPVSDPGAHNRNPA